MTEAADNGNIAFMPGVCVYGVTIPDAGLVERLEETLKRARSGETIGACWVEIRSDGMSYISAWAGRADTSRMLGCLSRLAHEMNLALDREDQQ